MTDLDEEIYGPELAEPEPAVDRFDEALASWGLVPAPDGWRWVEDSTTLALDKRSRGAEISFSGVSGPRSDGGCWFTRFPPDSPPEVYTSAPKGFIELNDAGADELVICLNPIDAARARQAGCSAAWFNGIRHGWRGGHQKPLPEIAELAAETVTLHLPGGDRDLTMWRSAAVLRKQLPHLDQVSTDGVNRIPVREFFDHANRPPTEAQLRKEQRRERIRAETRFPEVEITDAVLAARRTGMGKDDFNIVDGRGFRLDVDALARTILVCFGGQGLVMRGPGGIWAYRRGVWSPSWDRDDVAGGGGEIANVATTLLQGEYRDGHLRATTGYLVNLPELPTLHDHPVRDGWSAYVNFRDGLYDWRAGTFGPHDPRVLSTWQLPVDYDPEAPCPTWDRYLAGVLPADMLDPDEPAWAEDFGYLLHPGNPMHVAFLQRGGGRNGKGVYQDTVQAVAGAKHVSSLSLVDLLDGDRKFRLAQMVGSAVNICGEIDPSYLRSTAAFKDQTGGGTINVEHKYERPFPYRPWTTMLFSANEDFTTVDRSTAFFERWQVRRFPNFIPPEQRDQRLAEKIIAEDLPGIAAQAMVGLRRLMVRGSFQDTPSSVEQKGEFRANADHALRFLDERIAFKSGLWISRAEVQADYTVWCEEERIDRRIPASKLYAALVARGAELGVTVTGGRDRAGDARVFKGAGRSTS